MSYAVHSKTQKELVGECEYRKSNGQTVIVTHVEESPGCPNCQFPDKVDLGGVVSFVRRVSYGSQTFRPLNRP